LNFAYSRKHFRPEKGRKGREDSWFMGVNKAKKWPNEGCLFRVFRVLDMDFDAQNDPPE
jgi:hypothetical protein